MFTVTKQDDLQYVIDFDEADMSDLTIYAQQKKLSVETVLYDLFLQNLDYIADETTLN